MKTIDFIKMQSVSGGDNCSNGGSIALLVSGAMIFTTIATGGVGLLLIGSLLSWGVSATNCHYGWY